MAGATVLVDSLFFFEDIEEFVTGFNSCDRYRLTCSFDQQSQKFTIQCPLVDTDKAMEYFLMYFNQYSKGESDPFAVFDDGFASHKLSLVEQVAPVEIVSRMYADLDREFCDTKMSLRQASNQLVDLEIVRRREVTHQVERLYTKEVLLDLEEVSDTRFYLDGTTVLLKADSDEKADAAIRRMLTWEMAEATRIEQRENSSLLFDLHLRDGGNGVCFRFRSPSLVIDRDMAADKRYFQDYLQLVAVQWESTSEQYVQVGCVTGIHYGKAPEVLPLHTLYSDDVSQTPAAWLTERSKVQGIGCWRHQVATSANDSMERDSGQSQRIELPSIAHLTPSEVGTKSQPSGSGPFEHSSLSSNVSCISGKPTRASPVDPPIQQVRPVSSFEDSSRPETCQTVPVASTSQGKRPMTSEEAIKVLNFNVQGEALNCILAMTDSSKTLYRSELVLEARIGRILTVRTDVPWHWQPRQNGPGNAFRATEWPLIFHLPRNGHGHASTVFSSKIFDCEEDIGRLISVLDGRKEESGSDTSSFEITCRDQRDGARLILIAEDGKPIRPQRPSYEVGRVNIHVPSQTCDSKVSMNAYKCANKIMLKPFQTVIDHLWVEQSELEQDISRPVVGSRLGPSIDIESMETRQTISFAPNDPAFAGLEILITQRQKLQLMRDKDEFYGYLAFEDEMRRAGRVWWEISVRSSAIQNILRENQHLNLGETAQYPDMDVFKSQCKRIVELAQVLVAHVDSVGPDSHFHRTPSVMEELSITSRSGHKLATPSAVNEQSQSQSADREAADSTGQPTTKTSHEPKEDNPSMNDLLSSSTPEELAEMELLKPVQPSRPR